VNPRPGRLLCLSTPRRTDTQRARSAHRATAKVNNPLHGSPRTKGLRPRADHKRLSFSDDKHDHGNPLHLPAVFVNALLSSAF
jgi:hypothetical protein